jgi:hypothetical protein
MKDYAMIAYGGVDVWLHIFLNSALVRFDWSASRSGRFNSEELAPGTHWILCWVDTIAGLDDMEKGKILDPTGTRTPSRRS